MKKLLGLLVLLLVSIACPAQQNFMQVTAANILGTNNTPLPAGQIAFQPVDPSGNIIGYQVGGGGQQINWPTLCSISNGSIVGTCQVANVSVTNPMNVCFSVTIKDSSNRILLGGPGSGYTCVQPQTTNVWCANGVCNFDQFVPNTQGAPFALLGPARTFSLGGVYASTCPSGTVINGLADNTGRFSCVAGGGGVVGASVFVFEGEGESGPESADEQAGGRRAGGLGVGTETSCTRSPCSRLRT